MAQRGRAEYRRYAGILAPRVTRKAPCNSDKHPFMEWLPLFRSSLGSAPHQISQVPRIEVANTVLLQTRHGVLTILRPWRPNRRRLWQGCPQRGGQGA